MDDQRPLGGSARFATAKSQPTVKPNAELPLTFTPLTLMLVPTGMTVELTKADQMLGRHSSADVRLPLPDVSRRHCRFVYSEGCWQVIDLDSLNGVFVNNQRVRQTVIHNGDRIRIGSFVFEASLPRDSRRELRRAS